MEGDLPSAGVLYNVCNAFFSFRGIDVGDAREEICALVEPLCEMLHVREKDTRDGLFLWLKHPFRTGAITEPGRR